MPSTAAFPDADDVRQVRAATPTRHRQVEIDQSVSQISRQVPDRALHTSDSLVFEQPQRCSSRRRAQVVVVACVEAQGTQRVPQLAVHVGGLVGVQGDAEAGEMDRNQRFGKFPADCAASTRETAPARRAAAAIPCTSVMNPGAKETLGTVTSRVRRSIAARIPLTGTWPPSGATECTSIPRSRARLCHR